MLACLIGYFGDFDLAEEATADAFAVAAQRWPGAGMPDNPGAWLVTTARRRAIDRLRRDRVLAAKLPLLAQQPEEAEDVMDGPPIPDEREANHREYLDIKKLPGVVGGASLHPVETATTVRVQGGQTLVTDGPFADTKEVFGGFYLIEADDLDQATEIAARIPAARIGGSVEIRPVVIDRA